MERRESPFLKKNLPSAGQATTAGFRTGQRLLDHIELKESLGPAGYYEVWHAQDHTGKRSVIIKVLPPVLTQHPADDAKVQADIRHALCLSHPNIVKTYEVLHDNTWTALATEDLMGESLDHLMEKTEAGFFEKGKIKNWTGQLLEAFIHAHEEMDVVHGDLKLSNLLINEAKLLKISDFVSDRSLAEWAGKRGVSKSYPDTDAYRSPQLLSGKPATQADDIYAIGACLYTLLCGQQPFSGTDIADQVRQEVPESLSNIRSKLTNPGKNIPPEWEKTIAACLEKEPSKRPASVRKLAQRLGYEPPRSKARKASPVLVSPLKRNLRYAGLALAVLLSLAGITVWYQKIHLPAVKARQEEKARLAEEERLRAEEEKKRRQEAEQALLAEKEAARQREEAQRLAAEREREAAQAQTQARGSVRITTQPPGAQVQIDSLPPLTSPALFASVPLGNHKVQIQLKDHDPVELQIEVRDKEESAPAPVKLVRQKGSIRITSTPEKAKVFSGDKLLGETPLALVDLPTGMVFYQLRLKGYESQEINGSVLAGRESRLAAVLQKGFGPALGKDFTNALGMQMVWVEPLGCWVSKYETTQELFFQVMNSDPSQFEGPRKPVERVTWQEAQEFCRRVTNNESRSGRSSSNLKYRLPSEREWEIFAGDAKLADAVTGMDSEVQSTRDVGSKGPNQFGLYDVRGNVMEWCSDNFQGKADLFILRGGSWLNRNGESLQMGYRDFSGKLERSNNRGFRCIFGYDDP